MKHPVLGILGTRNTVKV